MSRQEKLAALASTGVTKAELDNIDGGTARGTTAIADGDGVLINDAGTMRMTSVETMATYMGTKITGGSLVYLASSGAISSGTASVSFTQFDATKYDHYQFHMQHVIPATDGATLLGHASTDGGSSYDTTNGNYHYNGIGDKTGFIISDGMGNDTNEAGISGIYSLFAPHVAKYTYGLIHGVAMLTNSYIYSQAHTTAHLAAQDTDALQFKFDSGNIASGEIVMYGIANGT